MRESAALKQKDFEERKKVKAVQNIKCTAVQFKLLIQYTLRKNFLILFIFESLLQLADDLNDINTVDGGIWFTQQLFKNSL